jgi:gliding motility-associated-like protein
MPSSSISFRNERSALSGAGQRTKSASFTSDNSIQDVAASSAASADFLGRSGLMPVYHFPSSVGSLTAGSCTPGIFVLSWRSPGNDGNAPGTLPHSYVVKLSTDPLQSPAASRLLFAQDPSAPGIPPAAALQGSMVSMQINGLTPGVTYYISVAATEADGLLGGIVPGTTAQTAITGATLSPLNGQTGFKDSLLWWPSPATGSSSGCTPVGYNVYRSTDPGVTGFTKILTVATTNWTDLGVLAGSTYYYEVSAFNSLGVEFTTSPIQQVFVRTAPTLPPTSVYVAPAISSTTITWQPPTEYNFGLPFVSSTAPRFDELTGYHVWRATGTFGPWTLVTTVSTPTTTAVDPGVFPGASYRVTAINITEESLSAYLVDPSGIGHIPAPDGQSQMILTPGSLSTLQAGPYWAESSTQPMTTTIGPQALPPAQKVYASVKFDVFTGTQAVTSNIQFQKPANLQMSYAPYSATITSPQQTSVFYDNGNKWLQLFGTADTANKMVRTEVYSGGLYQLRGVERTQDFSFNSSGLINKFITPNGDGKNDSATFTAQNPRNSEVIGKIYDLTGSLVTQFCDTVSNPIVCSWDGKANGHVVPGGVYIYQLLGDGHSFTGTVVVIR